MKIQWKTMTGEEISGVLSLMSRTGESRDEVYHALKEYKRIWSRLSDQPPHVCYYDWLDTCSAANTAYEPDPEQFKWEASTLLRINEFNTDAVERFMFPVLEGRQKVYIGYDNEGFCGELDEKTAQDHLTEYLKSLDRLDESLRFQS